MRNILSFVTILLVNVHLGIALPTADPQNASASASAIATGDASAKSVAEAYAGTPPPGGPPQVNQPQINQTPAIGATPDGSAPPPEVPTEYGLLEDKPTDQNSPAPAYGQPLPQTDGQPLSATPNGHNAEAISKAVSLHGKAEADAKAVSAKGPAKAVSVAQSGTPPAGEPPQGDLPQKNQAPGSQSPPDYEAVGAQTPTPGQTPPPPPSYDSLPPSYDSLPPSYDSIQPSSGSPLAGGVSTQPGATTDGSATPPGMPNAYGDDGLVEDKPADQNPPPPTYGQPPSQSSEQPPSQPSAPQPISQPGQQAESGPVAVPGQLVAPSPPDEEGNIVYKVQPPSDLSKEVFEKFGGFSCDIAKPPPTNDLKTMIDMVEEKVNPNYMCVNGDGKSPGTDQWTVGTTTVTLNAKGQVGAPCTWILAALKLFMKSCASPDGKNAGGNLSLSSIIPGVSISAHTI